MTEFNFTVRATDNLGAFADREFSINVRNTIVDRWVATVNNGSVITSPDGINWTYQQNIITGSNVWSITSSQTTSRGEVCHFNGKWFINAATNVVTSTDAKTWTSTPFPTINFSGQVYAPVLTQTSYMNPNWAKSPSNIGIVITMLSSNVNIYRSVLFMSSDGINWTEKWVQTDNVSGSVLPQSSRVVYGNGKWVISGNRRTIVSGQTVGYVSSDEGGTWSPITIPTASFAGGDITFINGKWILPRQDIQAYYISDDLVNWSYQTYNTVENTNFRFFDMNYGNGVISVFPEFSTTLSGINWNRVYSSVDLVNWSVSTLPTYPAGNNGSGSLPNSNLVRSATGSLGRVSSAFYNGQFIFGVSATNNQATTGGLLSSTDGKTYTKLSLPSAIGDDALIFGIASSSY